jgi:hypothetical protein
VPSYGAQPRISLEHCLEAQEIRKVRDRRLTWISLVFGLLFLPGAALWLAAYLVGGEGKDRNRQALRVAIQVLTVIVAAALLWRYHGTGGLWGWYLQLMIPLPVVGWFLARRVCLDTAHTLHDRWGGLLEGTGPGPKTSGAVPMGPEDKKAENLRKQLAAIAAEQDTNIAHYAGPKGILGMGRRYASWSLDENLNAAGELEEIRPFHNFDVIRRMEERLRLLTRSPLAEGGIPSVQVEHWIISAIGEGADEISRPVGPDMDGTRMRAHAVQNIANRQIFGNGPRHYLGTQFVLWEGQLVVTLNTTVTALGPSLRVEVTGHALGPLPALFTKKPKPPEIEVAKTFRFWEKRTVQLPLINSAAEVVRLAVRAPFTHFEWSVGLLGWLGGTLKLPEPFGLRSAWASKPWNNRFMADDAIRVSVPVLRAAHAALLELLPEQDVALDRFQTRSNLISAEMQSSRPSKADEYDAS